MNAQGWVLSRKLKREAAAESLFWQVVYDTPRPRSSSRARLPGLAGRTVPDSLIKLPQPKPEPVDTTTVPLPSLTEAAAMGTAALGQLPAVQDSMRLGPRYSQGGALHVPPAPGGSGAAAGAAAVGAGAGAAAGASSKPYGPQLPDSTASAVSPPDTAHVIAPPDTVHARPDTTHTAAPSDTSHKAKSKRKLRP
jgi:hypothetical protein